MIFDLLTSPQGHQLDRRLKISLAYCSTDHPRQFDMTHNHVKKNKTKLCSGPASPVHIFNV